MGSLKFDIKLKTLPVFLTDENGEKEFVLKEFNGMQRAIYNESFDMSIEMEDGKAKAVAGKDFKIFSDKKFLSMCLYDNKDVLVSEETIGSYPATVVSSLHDAALKLSGMDEGALESAKNELEEKDSSGTK